MLVLVNGRRWISSLGATVDLNTIPASAIERVEVLKDGASAIYGSDAIAGVVNIITRKDFEGVELSVYGGENASEGDGRQYSAEATFGVTSAKGGLLFNMSHQTQQPIFAGDRDVSDTGFSPTAANTQFGVSANTLSAANQAAMLAAGYTPNAAGRYTLMTLEGTGENTGIDRFRPVAAGNADNYNYAPDNYLSTPQERNAFYVQGYYDLTDDLRLVTDFVMTNRKSEQKLAPMPVTVGSLGGIAGSKVDIHADNIYNPFGETLYGSATRAAALGGYNALTYNPFSVRRRMLEAGPRSYTQNDNTFRGMIGLEGAFSFSDSWTWDAAYIYGENNQTELTTGLLNLTRMNQALGANCSAATSCVPLNIFGGPGTITGDMIDYITFDSVSRSGLTMKDYTFNTGGDLFEIPGGMVGMAVGIERREETGFDTPDPLTVTGESSGNQRDATFGGFRLDEAYAELSIPVMENLLLTPAVRYTDHSTFGSESTMKMGLEYRPFEDLLVRATWAEGYRAPSISQLYGGNADSFPGWTDPCNTVTAPTAANPTGDVIDISGLPGCAGVPQGYRQAAAQIRITQVASDDLGPETSTSQTVGFVYNPSWVEGLEFTLDYYKIELEDTIGRVGQTQIALGCANGSVPEYCNFVDRNPFSGEITDLRNFLRNSGELVVEGVDFYTAYRMPDTSFGTFKASFDMSYLITNSFNNEEQIGIQYGDTGYPRIKGTFSLDWMLGNWDAHWDARYIHSMQTYLGSFGYTEEDGVTPVLPTYIIHDMSVGYTLDEYNTKLTFGIENVFAKKPKPEGSNNNNAYSANNFSVAEYDVNMDRFVYVRATFKF